MILENRQDGEDLFECETDIIGTFSVDSYTLVPLPDLII
jgi:hypothetical protein